MKLPNWFKISWWIVLLSILTYVFLKRLPAIAGGQSNFVDAVLLIVWLALALAPIYKEINIFGFSLKQEIKELKEEVQKQIYNLQTEVKASFRTEISPSFHIPIPPPDNQLPEIEKIIQKKFDELKDYGFSYLNEQIPDELFIPEDSKILFAARYNLEKEIRRIWEPYIGQNELRRFMYTDAMLKELVARGVLDQETYLTINKMYSICSAVIHGETPSKKQLDFVKSNAQKLIASLKAIKVSV